MALRAQAHIDPAALAANAVTLRAVLSRGTRLCAVVKADGYGHGAALAAAHTGADWLAVATALEAAGLRAAGFATPRILVMGALSPAEREIALAARADIVAWNLASLDGLPSVARVHVKLDSGMGRLGTRSPEQATAVAEALAARGQLAGLMTHFATADVPGDPFFAEQLSRFTAWARPLNARFPDALVHAANSAATLAAPAAHFDMVRAGVALYGLDPANTDPARLALRPALRLTSYVAAVKACAAGESAGYGRRFVAARDTVLATVPIGYGDGWRRGLTNNADVVIHGERYPLVGTVSMDNITVDLGPGGSPVRPGDTVTLIGDGITAEEVAGRLGTLNYEVTCGLTARVTRTEVA
ncbi:MAG: Alanine racemase [uncultured Solirubrobacteraceae bacterium]|uniref:Alanine racemase n=1 Tax=uncultured Solirubrobacteraceae bacterium TaxID=1162706 RepID=A0A6J4RWP9_9ACTN|nr:MAG: Alanine racemase [uncultured Solirubrobacteraceae bacterium]